MQKLYGKSLRSPPTFPRGKVFGIPLAEALSPFVPRTEAAVLTEK